MYFKMLSTRHGLLCNVRFVVLVITDIHVHVWGIWYFQYYLILYIRASLQVSTSNLSVSTSNEKQLVSRRASFTHHLYASVFTHRHFLEK